MEHDGTLLLVPKVPKMHLTKLNIQFLFISVGTTLATVTRRLYEGHSGLLTSLPV